MKPIKVLFLIALLYASSLHAQYEKVLIPIQARDVPGAQASIWRSSLAITNHSEQPADVGGYGPCDLNACPGPLPIAANSTIFPGMVHPGGNGVFVSVRTTDVEKVTFQLRVQDISRQAQTWGTTIPTVRESQAFTTGTASLTDVVQNADFRSMLRIYGFDPEAPQRLVRVRIYGIDPQRTEPVGAGDSLLYERVLTIDLHPITLFTDAPMIELPLWTVPELQGQERLRIEVERASADLRFWAFVSITNNATQHVTILAPQ